MTAKTPMTTDYETPFDPAWTVNETMARYPATMEVFNRFGIDTCCGSGSPIREAAYRDDADPDALVDAIRAAVANP